MQKAIVHNDPKAQDLQMKSAKSTTPQLNFELLSKLEEQGARPYDPLKLTSSFIEKVNIEEDMSEDGDCNEAYIERTYLANDFLSSRISPYNATITNSEWSLLFENIVNRVLIDNEINYKWYYYVHSFVDKIINGIRPNLNRPNEVINYNDYVNVLCVKWKNHLKCEYVSGMVLENKIADRHMKTNIIDPKIVLVSGNLSFDSEKRSFFDIETIMKQEKQYINSVEKNILSVGPDVVIVEKVTTLQIFLTMF